MMIEYFNIIQINAVSIPSNEFEKQSPQKLALLQKHYLEAEPEKYLIKKQNRDDSEKGLEVAGTQIVSTFQS